MMHDNLTRPRYGRHSGQAGSGIPSHRTTWRLLIYVLYGEAFALRGPNPLYFVVSFRLYFWHYGSVLSGINALYRVAS